MDLNFWKKNKDKNRKQRQRFIEAYRLTAKGLERLKRQGDPTLSYEGAKIISFLKDGRQTIGNIVD